MKTIYLEARRWSFDRTYGNTYHSVAVYVDGEYVGASGMAYGYDNQFEETAADLLRDQGILPAPERFDWGTETLRMQLRRLEIELETTVRDGLKRDLHKDDPTGAMGVQL